MIITLLWELRQRRSAIIWWTAGSIIISVGILAVYPPIRGQAHQFNQVINQLPQGLRELKTGGAASVDVADPVSFLNSQLFYVTLPIVWIILAITRARSVLAKDEQEHTIELALARPISRTGLLAAKATALITEFVIIAGVTLLAIALFAPLFDLHIASMRLILVTAYTAVFSLSFGLISLALQAASGLTGRAASAIAVFLAFGGYLIASLSGLTDWLRVPAKFVPYHYFAPDKIMLGHTVPGLNIYLAGALILSAVVAYTGFYRRDIS